MEKLLQDVNFGDNLRKLRTAHEFTQMSLVARLQVLGSGLTRTAYNMIEQGKRNMYISDLLRLQHIYSVSFDEFYKDLKFECKKR